MGAAHSAFPPRRSVAPDEVRVTKEFFFLIVRRDSTWLAQSPGPWLFFRGKRAGPGVLSLGDGGGGFDSTPPPFGPAPNDSLYDSALLLIHILHIRRLRRPY